MKIQKNTTESTRVDAELLEAIKKIIPNTGQTITGYINVYLRKQVEKDLIKFKITEVTND